jgi:hypothetical protein
MTHVPGFFSEHSGRHPMQRIQIDALLSMEFFL